MNIQLKDVDNVVFNGVDISAVKFNDVLVWQKWEVIEYTGAVPVTITAAGEPLIELLISGNMSQSGTPSPTTPIQPQECGERTGNLFDATDIMHNYYISNADGEAKPADGSDASDYIEIRPNTIYNITQMTQGNWGAWYDDQKTFLSGIGAYGTVTAPQNAKYIRLTVNRNNQNPDFATSFMLTQGSTTPSTYIPYGYKLDISSGNTTTPVYLSEVETVRKIKKLVLTGEEDWGRQALSHTIAINMFLPVQGAVPNSQIVSNIATYFSDAGFTNDSRVNVGKINSTATNLLLDLSLSDFSTADAFKAYLQQQYANGTPVCVWYVLATPTTGILNEPLRKIGTYADTLSVSQTIPTVEGSNVIDVETTLKPSEVYIKYKGKS